MALLSSKKEKIFKKGELYKLTIQRLDGNALIWHIFEYTNTVQAYAEQGRSALL